MKRWLMLTVMLAGWFGCLRVGAAQTVAMRPADRATARIVAVSGSGDDDSWWGTGFFISNDGLMATAAHVVRGASVLLVIPSDPNAPFSIARPVYFSEEHDVALIRVDIAQVPTFIGLDARARQSPLTAGDAVSISGYSGQDPMTRAPALTMGHISRQTPAGSIELTAAVNPGQSGGPVVSADGAILGVVSARANPEAGVQSIAFIEPIERIREAVTLAATPLRGGANLSRATSRDALAELIAMATGHVTVSSLTSQRAEAAYAEATNPDERAVVILGVAHFLNAAEERPDHGGTTASALSAWILQRSVELIAQSPYLRVTFPALDSWTHT